MKFNLSSIILTFALLGTYCLAEDTETATEATEASASESQAAFATGEAQAKAAGDIVPLGPVGDLVAAQAPNNQPSWVFYQAGNGDLMGMRVSGPFSDGQRTASRVIVPSGGILPGSPIAATTQNAGFQDPGKVQVFFFNRNNILSEARLNKDRNWVHGTDCSACIDQKVRYEAVAGSKFIYALGST
ncbi:hypothetical protein AAF712_015118, partial [Marasmius tenuissimus]